jgi:uncharacterized protein YrzB (UPF0473 family)
VVEELDESEDLDDDDKVTLIDENGVEMHMVILAVADHEGQDYALLAPEDQVLDEDAEELELMIFQYDCDDEGNESFSSVDDESLYDKLRELFSEIVDTEESEEGA